MSDRRLAEVALAFLQNKMETGGHLVLNPKEVVRDVKNNAGKLGVSAVEAAMLAKILYEKAYEKTMDELERVIDPSRVGSDEMA